MRRREFITMLAGAALAWPQPVRAQQRLRTIGFLGPASAFNYTPWTTALVQRLRELGWTEGRTMTIEYRWAEGRSERYGEIAAEFVRLKADVIVTMGAAGAAVKQAVSTIPIVLAIAPDPVASGLVASLARPGGNVTGLSIQTTDLVGKRLELLREVVPGIRRLAALFDAAVGEFARETDELQVLARPLGVDVARFGVRNRGDIVAAFDALKGGADALYVTGGPLMAASRTGIHTLATAAKLPTTYNEKLFVEGGGLMSYGPNFADLFRRAGDYVDRILRGAKPADLPVEQPTKFDLVFNLTTARALGLKIPEAFLLRADEVIE
jgi:putative ABC transport system substrate-binding protein